MKRLLTSSVMLTLAAPSLSHAAAVYPGCAAPNLTAGHHTFYVDPIKGSQSGDGSAAKPWHTLAEVLNTSNKLLSTMGHNSRTWKNGDTSLSAVNPTGPIKPGDVLMLKTGNHGDVRLTNSYNSDFVTVMAAPGQTPTLNSLTVVSSGKWFFQGLKIQGAYPVKNSVTNLVSFGRGDYLGNTADIILDNSSLSTTDDTAAWTDDDWQNKTDSYQVLGYQSATCVAITNNHIYNGMNGVSLASNSSLVQGNTIEKMYNDGIDFLGSNQTIKQNTIRNNVNNSATSPLHPDGIQGWSLVYSGVPVVNKNDVIDSNTIVKVGDSNVTQMQGISVYDGAWDGLRIINNVVISNIWNGIAIYGGDNVDIVNNTVLQGDSKIGTQIIVQKSKSGVAGKNVVIRNNLATNIVIGFPSITFDHNIALTSIQTRNASNQLSIVRSGVVGSANKIDASAANQFYSAAVGASTYDLRLRPNSDAIGMGSANAAPTYDIRNVKRTTPIDVGAYQH